MPPKPFSADQIATLKRILSNLLADSEKRHNYYQRAFAVFPRLENRIDHTAEIGPYIDNLVRLLNFTEDTLEDGRSSLLVYLEILLADIPTATELANFLTGTKNGSNVVQQRPPKLFVSYRHKSWGFAELLVERLREISNADVFIDHEGIDHTDFEKSLKKHLLSSDAMLLIVTEHTFDQARIGDPKDWIRLEISEALQANIPVVPVLMDDSRIPEVQLLPENIRNILKCHNIAIDQQWWRGGAQNLINFLHRSVVPNFKPKSAYRFEEDVWADLEILFPDSLDQTIQVERVSIADITEAEITSYAKDEDYDTLIQLLEEIVQSRRKFTHLNPQELLDEVRKRREEKELARVRRDSIAILIQMFYSGMTKKQAVDGLRKLLTEHPELQSHIATVRKPDGSLVDDHEILQEVFGDLSSTIKASTDDDHVYLTWTYPRNCDHVLLLVGKDKPPTFADYQDGLVTNFQYKSPERNCVISRENEMLYFVLFATYSSDEGSSSSEIARSSLDLRPSAEILAARKREFPAKSFDPIHSQIHIPDSSQLVAAKLIDLLARLLKLFTRRK